MAAPDVKAIADAIAGGYGSLTPPTGYAAIRRSTAEPPNAIPTFPFVTVILPEGEIVIGPTRFTLEFQVRFWFAKHVGDQARDFRALNSWLGVLIMAGAVTVNAAAVAVGQSVKSALPGNFRFFVDTYAGTEAYGWEFDLPAIIRDWPLS